jgi:mannose-6-phosphate isomerase-like protein (cupin superfamily)
VSEKDYGLIPDRLAWELPLSDATSLAGPFQAFATPDADGSSGATALARSTNLGVYSRRFARGSGENGLHSHDQDAIWLVLEGMAEFHDQAGALIATLGAGHGVMVRALTSYRFVCREPSHLLRFAAAATADASEGVSVDRPTTSGAHT